MTFAQAAAWANVSKSTVHGWVVRWRQASPESGPRRNGRSDGVATRLVCVHSGKTRSVLREIRERKERARAAVEETERLEAPLAALTQERAEKARAARPGGSRRRVLAGRRAPRGANRAAVLAVVSERPGVSAAELAGATGIARATINSALYKLVAVGTLERVALPAGTHGYRLAEAAGDDGAADELVDDRGS